MASRVIAKWLASAQSSHNSWERFAELDPYLYILTDMKRTDPRVFWKSGEQLVRDELLPVVQSHDVGTGVALELGCGIGRLALPLASHFRQVLGVDIARGMVQRATSFAKDNGIENVVFASISGPEDFLQQTGKHSGNCNFLYSLLVFQHIPDFSVIEGYLHVIRTLLHKRGIAYLQFDTRPATALYRLKTGLPDSLLPRFYRRGIRRIRRSTQEIEAAIKRARLEIVEQLTPRTQYHRYILRLPRNARVSQ
jgi:SAM-dependent methyltransferase